MSNRRKMDTSECKAKAVRLVIEENLTYAEAARRVGVSSHKVSRWVEEFEASVDTALPPPVQFATQEEQIEYLKAEKRRVEMEIEILKKAKAYFTMEGK